MVALGRFGDAALKTFRLALPKIGVGWMFALLTSNFNRVAIVELGVAAVIITTMIGLHHFLSPFQVVFGRLADRNPLFGLRRTPYLLLGALVASTVFVALPGVAVAMSNGVGWAVPVGFVLLLVFGVGIAAMGDCHHALIAEVTEPKSRGGVIAVVWTFTILSTIIAAGVIKSMMPEYDAAAMQSLYNLTPLVVLGSVLLGVVGVERRLHGQAMADAIENSRRVTPPGNPLASAATVLRGNRHARAFFAFVFLSILGIFLQDSILEVFGAEQFGMSIRETTTFTQIWGGGVLLAMIVTGIVSAVLPVSKKLLALVGGLGTAAGLALLTACALSGNQALLSPAILLMGLATGMYNVGALSLMMEMTVDGATGLYMGIWAVAQAFGTATASITSGALHTALIAAGTVPAGAGYGLIFGLETLLMVLGALMLRGVSVAAFHEGVTRQDLVRTMEATAAA
jgi:BCD family chlorophyll transporter-like MFS transporter